MKALLEQNMPFVPTACQSELMAGLAHFIASGEPDKIMLIKGFAGTGKTTMIDVLVKTLTVLKIRVVLLAPTGRAAKVMSGYTGMPAFTVHKKIYRQQTSSDGTGRFVIDKNLFADTWFVIDEVSMISNESSQNSIFGSGRLLDDILEYVYSGKNCHLILVGDTAQLPPVGLPVSPALEAHNLKSRGFTTDEFTLTEVVRQTADSGILSCATQIRNHIEHGDTRKFLHFKLDSFDDVVRISGGELIEQISNCYSKYGIHDTTIVTRSNKRVSLYNKGIRGTILYRENEIERGDLLMVVKNNYYWGKEVEELGFIANGESAEVVSIYGYEELYGFRFADVCLRFTDYDDVEIDCKIFLDTLALEAASFTYEQNRQLFETVSEDYMDIRNRRKRWEKIRENPHFNALQVKYAYALTCHKAQGGQWKAVFIDHGFLKEEMLDREYYRWLYTAFTRPVEKLYLVNFNKGFFDEQEK